MQADSLYIDLWIIMYTIYRYILMDNNTHKSFGDILLHNLFQTVGRSVPPACASSSSSALFIVCQSLDLVQNKINFIGGKISH